MKIYFQALVGLLLIATTAFGQSKGITFTGQVVDAADDMPLPFATISLLNASNDATFEHFTTDGSGRFSIRSTTSNVVLSIQFIGYNELIIRDFDKKSPAVNLGIIKVKSATTSLDEVQVTAEKSTVEFKMDKRVFNVGNDISSKGMGALDVLNKVPSVNVNIDGEVSLRGNSGVQILINGKPSVLADEQSNALGTITSDMIESIEVITNPSAKYEAEGTSGIINIILKKEDKKGVNGSISFNTGIPNNHSIGGSINYRTENFNFFTQFGAGYRSRPNYNNSLMRSGSDSSEVSTEGSGSRNENFYNITLGTDYYINEFNTITLSGNYAYEIETNPSTTNFSVYDAGSLVSKYSREENTDATNPKYQFDLQYRKQFENNKDHVLLLSSQGSFFGKDQSSEFTNTFDYGTDYLDNQRTETDYYQRDYTFKLDYTNPLTKLLTIEAGSAYEINDVGNDYAVYNLNNNNWLLDSSLTNNFKYNQQVLGVYATAGFETEEWGIKLGLRAENTNLNTVLTNTGQSNVQDYFNFFPSAHASYKWSKRFSLQAGYSKRIYRPRLWDLNPFFNIQNNYNIRTGNPNLRPEYADSYELTGIAIFEKASFNASIYHLYTTDVKEYISVYTNNVNVTLPMNIGTNRKTGFELNGKYTPLDWLNLNGDFNYGYFIREGSYETRSFNFSNDQWSGKLTASFKMPADWEFEVTSNYQSSYQTVQGSVSGYAFMDLGVRKKIWKGKAVVNFGVSDLFASRIRESIVDMNDYYLYNFSQRGRFLTLGISYGFGKGEAMTYSGSRHH